METNYLFTENITNSPHFPNITRKISFLSHPVYEINSRLVKTELIIRHFDTEEIPDLNRGIVLVTDNAGPYLPIGMDIDGNGNIIGLDTLPIVSGIEWFIHWLQVDKGMFSMFKLITKLYDIRQYDKAGNDVGPYSPEAYYTFFDLKYFGLNTFK